MKEKVKRERLYPSDLTDTQAFGFAVSIKAINDTRTT